MKPVLYFLINVHKGFLTFTVLSSAIENIYFLNLLKK